MHFVSSEALLEMYFLSATLKELGAIYGPKSLRLIKPSPQDEKWIGIDQAWVASDYSDKDFINHLKKTVSSGIPTAFYFAVFRQYKRVEKLTKISKHTPDGWSTPYYRCDLYTEPGHEREGMRVRATPKTVGNKPKIPAPEYSQHEALIRLSSLNNADVHYACPMIFSPIDVWKEPDMNDVRLVPVRPNQPTYRGDGKLHHLCFRSPSDTSPEFHSDEGISADCLTFQTWQSRLQQRKELKLSPFELLTLLVASDDLLSNRNRDVKVFDDGSSLHSFKAIIKGAETEADRIWNQDRIHTRLSRDLPEFLTVIEVSPNNN